MNVLVLNSVSRNIADIAALTVPNKADYCRRHGYSLLVEDLPYDQAIRNLSRYVRHFEQFDMIWTLDADAVITNMSTPVHEIPCLGENITACREDMVEWNYINCGSVVWRNAEGTRAVIAAIDRDEHLWKAMPCGWQTWMGSVARKYPELVTAAPPRTFNSVAWSHPGGGEIYFPGSNWHQGDFVYHPCSVFPHDARVAAIRDALGNVQ